MPARSVGKPHLHNCSKNSLGFKGLGVFFKIQTIVLKITSCSVFCVFMSTDLVPFRTMLVEQCQPLRYSSLQNQEQQCGYEEMRYALQEYNYETHGERNSQVDFILVKQEVRVYLSSKHSFFHLCLLKIGSIATQLMIIIVCRKMKLGPLWSAGNSSVIKQVRN